MWSSGTAGAPPSEMAPMSAFGSGGAYGAMGDAATLPPGAPSMAAGKVDAATLAKLTFAEVKTDLVVTARDMPALLMPWVLFCTALLPVALMGDAVVGFLALALCAALGIGFLLLSAGRAWQMLAATCVIGAALGGALGEYDRMKYLDPYFVYSRSPSFRNVSSADKPVVYRGAGYLSFKPDSRVDTSRGLGYTSNGLWCVAPIVNTAPGGDFSESVGFWAVGQDCCQQRGLFVCGAVLQRAARGGVVVHGYGPGNDVAVRTYMLAAQAAAATYGLMLPENPIFVDWGEDADTAQEKLFSEASDFASSAVFGCFVVVPVFALLLSCLNLSLTRRTAETGTGKHWNPEKVEQMRFGLDVIPRRYDRELQMDLLNSRCHWSGEVIYDYAFHLANKHTYIGCFLSHPGHPYTKLERFTVCTLATLIVVFTVAVVTVALAGKAVVVRWAYMLFVVTFPRTVLKLYLVQAAQQEQAIEDGGGPPQMSRRAPQSAVVFVAGAAVATAVLCIACAAFLRNASEEPLGKTLWSSCDSIGVAALLEPIFDLTLPYFGTEVADGTTIGFFGRWMAERQAYSERAKAAEGPAEAEPSVARALEASKGRPLFHGLGSEILFGRGQRSRKPSGKQLPPPPTTSRRA